MAWFKKARKPMAPPDKASRVPEGLYVKCPGCSQLIYNKDLTANVGVCVKCSHHFRLSATERLQMLFDGEYEVHDSGLMSTDPLSFTDTKPYKNRLKASQAASGAKDAVITAWKWTYNPLGTTATLKLTVAYKTTLTQEQKVDAKIKSVLESLKLENKSDYKKVKAIHDYIINLVSYDKTFVKYSAYNALIDKSSVCEGYAAAAYRMFTDAGISSRIITGVADGGSHAWNIVKVNGTWYNIDLTWDDPITSNGKQILEYDYFHSRFIDFKTIMNAIEKSLQWNLEVWIKAFFLKPDINCEEDEITFDYIKKIKKSYSGVKFIFKSPGKEEMPYRRAIGVEEKTFVYK
jgi:hypothetical protein